MAKSSPVDQAAGELYGLPPDEFTRARDEKAKELRSQGDRDSAAAVKALRKPTVAAAALNVLARSRAKEVERLLDAGEKLRAAQEELLSGGDRAAFGQAVARERELVSELTAEAPAGLEEKVAATLHAAALDPELAEELRAGRLVREQEAIGGFGSAGPAGPAPERDKGSRASGRTRPPKRAKAKPAGGDPPSRERLAAARTDERHARRELEAAERALEHAQARADAAQAHAAEAAERAKTTAERLKDAKRAQAAARKAHARAERALESEQRGPARKP